MNRAFHALGFAIVSNETADDYFQLLDDFRNVVREHQIDFNPRFVMSDGARAIINACRRAFEGTFY